MTSYLFLAGVKSGASNLTENCEIRNKQGLNVQSHRLTVLRKIEPHPYIIRGGVHVNQ